MFTHSSTPHEDAKLKGRRWVYCWQELQTLYQPPLPNSFPSYSRQSTSEHNSPFSVPSQ